jgi:hypothetical protein
MSEYPYFPQSYIDFAADAPGYGPLVNASVIKQLNETWLSPNGCLAQEEACYTAGNGSRSNTICTNADNGCVSHASHRILEPEGMLIFLDSSSRHLFPS